MEQKSNVQNRAEKEYKNSREKFYLLLREIISNSIQAVLIRKDKDIQSHKRYSPELTLNVSYSDKRCSIELRDNGEGFTEINTQCFDELDKRNPEKERYNFHPLGQGRLAIVFFTDKANYETVYKDEKGIMRKKFFPYPNPEEGLFSLFDIEDEMTDAEDTYTILKIVIDRQNTLSRANTFFKKYDGIASLKQWVVETFFPALVSNDDLVIKLVLNGEVEKITRKSIEAETKSLPFKMMFEDEREFNFKLWLVNRDAPLRKENPIICFARDLKAELENGKLRYALDNEDGYSLYLTSEYFDEHVDTKGEKIEISSADVSAINEKINKLLDDFFKETITKNQEETKRNLKNFKKRYPSLDVFIPEQAVEENKGVMEEDDLVKVAIETKGKYEKKFWSQMSKPYVEEDTPYEESIECHKLLNSSLHIYVKHRERILERLFEMIKPYGEDGEPKPELESDVQELLFKRGNLLDSSRDINHLHNLWILDDKFTTFSSTLKGKSTKPGEEKSDIYIWSDDPESVKQVLILELKSTTHAHNAGNSKEGMIGQVKRYAKDVYNKPQQILNWNEDTSNIQYQGIILARKADIVKEVTSISAGGGFNRIPFLKDSRYKDDEFYPTDSEDLKVPIRIELYSFEDIYKLASNRNKVFFKLLKNEFEVTANMEEEEK